ncbi:unnamed protein product [Auanema sp. JU1783]|nr:unnamed protein product [Auanema sp. JU1783]
MSEAEQVQEVDSQATEQIKEVESQATEQITEDKSELDILKDEIRKFSLNSLNSSVKNHDMILTALTKAVERTPEIPEPYLKGLVKLVTSVAVRRYNQPKSFQLVSRLLQSLAKHDSQAVALATSTR